MRERYLMKHDKRGRLSAEKISTRVLYVLLLAAVVVFAAFYAIGFSQPFEENPNFNEPLLTNAILLLMALLLLGTLATAVWAVLVSRRMSRDVYAEENGIKTKRMAMLVAASTFVVMVLSFVLGSSKPLLINATPFTDVFWLKTADMFVWSSVIMLVVALVAVAYGYTRYYRKEKQ